MVGWSTNYNKRIIIKSNKYMAYIISELHGQYGGNLRVAEQMILQSKFGGADAVKVQLYSPDHDPNSKNGDKPGDFLSLTFDELKHLKEYADMLNIDFFSSVCDEERLGWCLKLGFDKIKIPNKRTIDKPELCEKVVAAGKYVLISINSKQIEDGGLPYKGDNVHYLYTEPLYPGMLEEINMPDFEKSYVEGYSDHTMGITAVVYALSRGAKIIEKHFTIDHSWQKTKEKAHACSMNFNELQQIKGFSRGLDILKNKKLYQYED